MDTPIKSEYDEHKESAQGSNSSFSGLTGESSPVRSEKTTTLDSSSGATRADLRGNDVREDKKSYISSFSGLTGESRGFVRSKTTTLDAPIESEHDGKEKDLKKRHAKISEENPDRSGNGPCIQNPQFEAIRLDPNTPDTLPRVPMLEGNMIPLPADGRWVRVDTPDGPMAMRSIAPPEPEYYIDDDVWEDDYWNGEWDDDP
jgi:hypothetical protein